MSIFLIVAVVLLVVVLMLEPNFNVQVLETNGIFVFVFSGIKQFLCEVCHYYGVTQSDLNRHKKTQGHCLRSRNVCHICGLGYFSRQQKANHMLTCHQNVGGSPGSSKKDMKCGKRPLDATDVTSRLTPKIERMRRHLKGRPIRVGQKWNSNVDPGVGDCTEKEDGPVDFSFNANSELSDDGEVASVVMCSDDLSEAVECDSAFPATREVTSALNEVEQRS